MRPSLRQVLFRSAGLDLNFAGGVFSLNNTRTASPANIPGWSFSRTDTNGTATALDLAGNVIQFATGVPRITNRGILVEEARTNSLRNSVAAGAVAGTPGTAPTNWSIDLSAGLSSQIVGTGTEAGLAYVDIRIFGSTSGSGNTIVWYESSNAIAASNGQVWAPSFFIGLAAGTLSNVSDVRSRIELRNVANGFLSSGAVGTAVVPTAQRQYFSTSTTIANALAAFIRPGLSLFHAAAAAVDVTFRLSQPDMQLGAFATSPIITTGAAGTRGVDLPSQPFDLPAAYTLFSEAEVPLAQSGVFPTVVSTSGANNGLYLTGTNVPGVSMSNGTYVGTVAGSLTTGTIVRHAVRAETNNVRAAINGTLATLGTTFSPITGSRILYVGSNIEVASRLNGYIRRIRILPTAVSDAQLQALTAP